MALHERGGGEQTVERLLAGSDVWSTCSPRSGARDCNIWWVRGAPGMPRDERKCQEAAINLEARAPFAGLKKKQAKNIAHVHSKHLIAESHSSRCVKWRAC